MMRKTFSFVLCAMLASQAATAPVTYQVAGGPDWVTSQVAAAPQAESTITTDIGRPVGSPAEPEMAQRDTTNPFAGLGSSAGTDVIPDSLGGTTGQPTTATPGVGTSFDSGNVGNGNPTTGSANSPTAGSALNSAWDTVVASVAQSSTTSPVGVNQAFASNNMGQPAMGGVGTVSGAGSIISTGSDPDAARNASMLAESNYVPNFLPVQQAGNSGGVIGAPGVVNNFGTTMDTVGNTVPVATAQGASGGSLGMSR